MKTFEMTQKMMKKMQDGKNMKKLMKGINPNDLKNFKMQGKQCIRKYCRGDFNRPCYKEITLANDTNIRFDVGA